MIALDARLKAVGGAHTGIAPVSLLDVQDANGNLYFWADRKIIAPNMIPIPLPAAPAWQVGARIYVPSYPATLIVDWEDQVGESGFNNGRIQIDFNGQGWATITYLGTNSLTFFANDFGTADQHLVGAAIGISGPVPMPMLPDAGEELVLQCFSPSGTFISGSGTGNSDDLPHARIFWLSGNPTSYVPWLLSVPEFTFNRSLQSDVGEFVVQNLSGDTLSRDFERIVRRSTLEGAMFVYRLWQPDAESVWMEVHGTLTLQGAPTDTATLKGVPLINPAQDDTPLEQFCETCQLQWAGKRCGSTHPTECEYNYQTCQVVERIMVVLNSFEKNFGEAVANTAQRSINRTRKI